MADIKDVYVNIDVLHPNPVAGLGIPLILTEGTTASYKEYRKLDALKADFVESTTAYKLAKTEFEQKNKAVIVAVATYKKVGTDGDGLLDVVKKYVGKAWHFALFADATAVEVLPVAQLLQENKFKFAVLQSANKGDFTPFSKLTRTIKYFHAIDSEFLGAAVIGNVANLPVGQATWKFRINLVGITPNDELTAEEIDELHAMGVNTYITKAGVPQTSEGLVAEGEFVDFYHGQDFVKSDAETRLQLLLSDNDKIPASDIGISMIASTLMTTLEIAGQQGIIEKTDEGYAYTLQTAKYSEGTELDQLARVYAGVSFSYTPQNAFHKIRVNGSVQSNK